jgi:hypothetical protein
MDSKTRATNLVNATLGVVIVMLALLVPAYSQQDVAPAWFDPTATANEAVVQHPQLPAVGAKNKREASSASPTGRKSKAQAQVQATSNRNRKELAAKSGINQGVTHPTVQN